MVVDTSVILSIYLNEPKALWCSEQLRLAQDSGQPLLMSTVSLTEVLIRSRDLAPHDADRLEQSLLKSTIQFVAPDIRQSQLAADARKRLPLNLGDCFVYALAVVKSDSILTLDHDFRSCDVTVLLP